MLPKRELSILLEFSNLEWDENPYGFSQFRYLRQNRKEDSFKPAQKFFQGMLENKIFGDVYKKHGDVCKNPNYTKKEESFRVNRLEIYKIEGMKMTNSGEYWSHSISWSYTWGPPQKSVTIITKTRTDIHGAPPKDNPPAIETISRKKADSIPLYFPVFKEFGSW